MALLLCVQLLRVFAQTFTVIPLYFLTLCKTTSLHVRTIHNLKVQSIYFCNFVALVDQTGRAAVSKYKKGETAGKVARNLLGYP
jgi:hypothetical protein